MVVAVPCFNQARYLPDCLASLVAQTFSEWEGVVVDDASTNGDVDALVSSFHDRRLRTIRHTRNRGLAAARNTALSSSGAELLLALDADDALEPEFLEQTIAALHQSDADCAFTDFRLFGTEERDIHFTGPLTAADMLVSQWLPGAGTLMRREIWERVGGYCEEFHSGNEDWDFWLSVVAEGLRAVHVPAPLYRYRQHGESWSASPIRSTEYLQREVIYARHRELFDAHGAGTAFRAAGYLNSAKFAWRSHERRGALRVLRLGLGATRTPWPFIRLAAASTGRALRRRLGRV